MITHMDTSPYVTLNRRNILSSGASIRPSLSRRVSGLFTRRYYRVRKHKDTAHGGIYRAVSLPIYQVFTTNKDCPFASAMALILMGATLVLTAGRHIARVETSALF